MNFGLIVSKQHPPGVSMVDRFREHVDQVRAARDAGFDLIVMGQHYLSTPFQEMQTLPALARLAAEAGTMRVGATVILLPLLNPVDVAEQVATLDVITEGASSSAWAWATATRRTRPSASPPASAWPGSSRASR